MSVELVDTIAVHLSTLDCVKAVGLVGSGAFSPVDAGDYDLCAFMDIEGNLKRQVRRELWSAENSPIRPGQVAYGGGDRFTIDDVLFSIDYWQIWKYQREIDKVIKEGSAEATAEPWFTLKTCPESVCADVARCRILWDPDDIIKRWQREVAEYPLTFRANVIGDVLFEARYKLADIRRARELNDVSFFHMAQSDLCFCLLRVLFALNRTYFCSAKRATREMSALPITPENCRERIEALLSAPLLPDRLSSLADEARALVRETAELAMQEEQQVREAAKRATRSRWPDAEPLE